MDVDLAPSVAIEHPDQIVAAIDVVVEPDQRPISCARGRRAGALSSGVHISSAALGATQPW
jgi:hypothetical protein